MRKEKKIGEAEAETEETCHLQDLVHLHFNRTNRTLIIDLLSRFVLFKLPFDLPLN